MMCIVSMQSVYLSLSSSDYHSSPKSSICLCSYKYVCMKSCKNLKPGRRCGTNEIQFGYPASVVIVDDTLYKLEHDPDIIGNLLSGYW